jgi:hypothetical protein
MAMGAASRPTVASELRHCREVRPLVFPDSEPESERVSESKRHLELRTFLYALLRDAFAAEHSIGSEQFVYFNGRDPRRCCSPDAFVKLGVPDTPFPSWKTWNRGAPELVVEITSPSDEERWTWAEKFERFYEMGVREVVRFDPDGAPEARIRVWDRVEDDLVERVVGIGPTPCVTLGLWWVVASVRGFSVGLRLARDPEGRQLLSSAEERARIAEQRVSELEAQLGKRR